MAIIGIVAVDRAGAIGKGGGLPWHYSADLKFFKEQTTGNACVMGYTTWASLKKPLPNRLNVVLSRYEYLNCDLYVLGGAQVFELFRERIGRWLVTEVPLTVEDADTFLPAGLLEGFRPYDS